MFYIFMRKQNENAAYERYKQQKEKEQEKKQETEDLAEKLAKERKERLAKIKEKENYFITNNFSFYNILQNNNRIHWLFSKIMC